MVKDELVRELGGIEAACAPGSTGDEASGGDNGVPLCLYRVVSGLTHEAWQRLKEELELGAWRAAPHHALLAPSDEPQLLRFLSCEMDRARLCQQPLALALVEPEDPEAFDTVFDLARAQLRSFDLAARLDSGTIALVLSGTPLAAAERLIGAMLRRIRQICEPTLVCSAGLVGYGGLVQLTAEALLERAEKSVEDARRLGGNRLEVAPSADAVLASRETLVRASEKHFLFTGKKLPE
ncbi:MAG TPA: GGDEF domain-containing protein [Humidesulfovibrio sp.]|uniref:GGDEF domain-containing protein n=1 Tax=Humidesulfovibrio sp. TaxID=2910988 RepID=UPI002C00D987|nr:GGDEF domain-containing protein [Humidesulfovibrio sp.]HWR02731.1 GGDEF domain-containing protein [Humidesulfovibrio sp.]